MMDKITSLWDRFSLTAKEEVRVDLSSEKGTYGGVLAAKFCTKRVINIESVMCTLKPIWRAVCGFKGRNMGNNMVMFLFENTVEMEWVLANGPWSFDKFLILLKHIDDDRSFSNVVFNSCAFWVQIHDLPPRHMTITVCEKIAGTLGRVEHVEDFDEGSSRGNFMRARVILDVEQPLCQGRKVWLGGDRDHWVSFKFERLPNFCYWCGRVNHGDRDCVLWLQSKGTLSIESQQYGRWLRGDFRQYARGSTMGGSPSTLGPRSKTAAETGGVGLTGMHEVNPIRGTTSITPTDSLTFTDHEVNPIIGMHEVNPVMGNTSIKPTDSLTFTDHLKEIDRDLGLNQGIFRASVQMPAQVNNLNLNVNAEIGAGIKSLGATPPVHVGPVLDGPSTMEPLLESSITSAQVNKPKKPNGGSWKCIARLPMSPSRQIPITPRSN